ncbi:MAG: class I SAM-dependent methyltransferase [Candidatus Parcubacteria bacterium]|nr:class I SAM-dependent methyltransferase [Candidatus Parcubacteria bacterium]
MLLSSLIILKYLLLIIALIILGFISFIMFSFRDVVPFVPTPKKIIRHMIELADIKDNERIVDLGSGTGRILIKVAKRHKKNLLVGIEKSFTLRLVSKIFLFLHPFIKSRIQIVNQDFFNTNLNEFEVIFCFLTPAALRTLTPKFQNLKPGTRIISYMFPLEDTIGFQEVAEHITSKDSIYLYKKI